MEALFLLRHGPAYPSGTAEFSEADRPLTDKGRRKVRQVARGLDALKLDVSWIVASPMARALETAEIAAEILGLGDHLETCDALSAGRSAESIRQWLQARTEARLMLVGHDPWISDLIGLLTTGRIDPSFCQLRKAGVAALSRQAAGRFTLDWLARPKLLRKIGG